MRSLVFLVPAVLLLAACGDQGAAPDSSSASGMREAVDATASVLSSADAPLLPGQSVQGVIRADVGHGRHDFRSLQTRVADNIAEQVDEKLASRDGQRVLDQANQRREASGGTRKVDADDVRDVVGAVAGKTFHDAVVRRVEVISSLEVSLSGKAVDGGMLDVSLSFDESSLTLTRAGLSYRPSATSMLEYYESAKGAPPDVVIERFEKNPDGSYAIAGSFLARDVPASRLSRKLSGKTLSRIEGRFDFSALPLKEMPKIGR